MLILSYTAASLVTALLQHCCSIPQVRHDWAKLAIGIQGEQIMPHASSTRVTQIDLVTGSGLKKERLVLHAAAHIHDVSEDMMSQRKASTKDT